MKKIFNVILALFLCVSLAACQSGNQEASKDSKQESGQAQSQAQEKSESKEAKAEEGKGASLDPTKVEYEDYAGKEVSFQAPKGWEKKEADGKITFTLPGTKAAFEVSKEVDVKADTKLSAIKDAMTAKNYKNLKVQKYDAGAFQLGTLKDDTTKLTHHTYKTIVGTKLYVFDFVNDTNSLEESSLINFVAEEVLGSVKFAEAK